MGTLILQRDLRQKPLEIECCVTYLYSKNYKWQEDRWDE